MSKRRRFYAEPHELLQCLQVKSDQIPQCAKRIPRLKGKSWFLTKQVQTFRPEEMHDLEFAPAIPAVARVLRSSEGTAAAALQILLRINRDSIPRAELVRLLGSPRIETVRLALNRLQDGRSANWPNPPPTAGPGSQSREDRLTSAEATPLMTNQLTMARLLGLKVLSRNADAEAVALTLPLLRDTNSIVRRRAFAVLRAVSGHDIPEDDPMKWEEWWKGSKGSFNSRKPAP